MMVVVRPRTLVGDEERTVTRTVDVRLEKGADGWTVSELASTGGEPPVSPAVTPTGEAALANPNLELSDTARWDIEAGRISDPILDALNGSQRPPAFSNGAGDSAPAQRVRGRVGQQPHRRAQCGSGSK